MDKLRFSTRAIVAMLLICVVGAGTGYALVSGNQDIATVGSTALVGALGAAMARIFPPSNGSDV
jgi:uncharacterized membrane protein